MFRLAFISTLLVISIVNLWALNCKECMGEGPDGDKKDCWEGKDGVDQGKRDTSFFSILYHIVLYVFIQHILTSRKSKSLLGMMYFRVHGFV